MRVPDAQLPLDRGCDPDCPGDGGFGGPGEQVQVKPEQPGMTGVSALATYPLAAAFRRRAHCSWSTRSAMRVEDGALGAGDGQHPVQLGLLGIMGGCQPSAQPPVVVTSRRRRDGCLGGQAPRGGQGVQAVAGQLAGRDVVPENVARLGARGEQAGLMRFCVAAAGPR